ncbi:Hypothetical predicted protein [Mytilus galloprovincialis]|uniref:Tesmin/TSO1-like CXC domain-containing protein n=1 Tax=Mytilus galloprovincialis TaxID=29158 RepID=A0A8B6GIA2_MYTGA|nr:Hypothetical predicted protein [Mytilus galloprovincialis]
MQMEYQKKVKKSWATSVFKKMYPVSFISSLPPPPLNTDIAYVIDGMFIINTIPLSVHKTFLDYARFLFDKWVVRPHFQFKATEVHLVFDHPNRQGTSPKDIERSRRDISDQTVEFDQLSPATDLPSNWRSFLFWAQASENFLQLSPLSDFGWKVSNNLLECIWDTEGNFQKVEQTVQWYTKGCSCKTGCSTNRCKCRKSKSDSKDGFCGPGCKCINCVNLPDKSDTLDISLSDMLSDEISDVEIDDDHDDDDDDDNDDVDDPAEAHLFSDLDMFYLASEDL